MTTRRDNLRKILAGERPDWVPFAPNFAQWFRHRQAFDSLPDELAGCATYIEAMKTLGCDIFSRNVDGGYRERDPGVTIVERDEPSATGPRRTIAIETPEGTLRMVRVQQTALSTSYEEAHFVKDWERDGPAFRRLLEQREYDWDEDAFAQTNAAIGEDGLVNVPAGCTPLKMLHHHLGLQHTCLFLVDRPEAAKEMCDLYWERFRPVLRRLAEHPEVESVILMDNVDTPFYPPAMAALYWEPYVADAAALMHACGKRLFVHACGKLAGLSTVFACSGVDGLEGVAHPPLGDWPAPAAQACHPEFIFIGGFGAHEQESMSDDDVRAFYRDYLAGADRERFIFSASCQTSINTRWERIKLVRDICREWGGRPA